MKLHDNTRFRPRAVVLGTCDKLLKSQALVGLLRSFVRGSNLQENRAREIAQPPFDQGSGDTLASKLRGHSEVQDFGFARYECTRHNKPGYAGGRDRDAQMIRKILADFPLGG